MVEHLTETIARPAMGPPGPPARLRVATEALAELLRADFPEIEIVVAPTPELDAIAASLADFIAAGRALADEDAWPSLVCVEPDLSVRPPTARELVLGEALARAIALAVEDPDFAAAWTDDEPVERTLRVPTHDGMIDVRLEAPIKAQAPDRDPDAVPARVYRLKLELEDIDPDWPDQEVSRTAELAGDDTLWNLHHVIQDAFDRDNDHLFHFHATGKPRERKHRHGGYPMGDLESRDDEERSVTGTTLDDLALEPRRVMRYTFDDEWLVRIAVSRIRDGGPDDFGLPRTVASIGEPPPQYGSGEG